jgi:hypothetical protein
LIPNEFYFDKQTGHTLIECTRLALPYGNYLGCMHYYVVVPSMKSIGEVGATSDAEISEWRMFDAGFKNIAASLRAK